MNHSFQSPESRTLNPRFCGFTLIELLVAMSILVVIVLIVSQIFAQATIAWNTGSRRAEMNMTGRAVADFISQDLSQAVRNSNHMFNASGYTASFWYLGDATNTVRATNSVSYRLQNNAVERKVNAGSYEAITDTNILMLTFIATPLSFGTDLPDYVDVQVTVSDNAPLNASNKVFESRAEFPNRNRYRF